MSWSIERPHGRAWRRIVLAFGLFLVSVFSRADTQPSVAFWYAPAPPLPELAQFDWVVLEPAHIIQADLNFLHTQGSQAFAYLSIGELDAYQAERYPLVAQNAATAARNHGWDSQVMDLASPVWRDHLIGQARDFQAQGYDGLFLDTLDSFMLLPSAEREAQRTALVELLQALQRSVPGLELFFNRGFEVIPELRSLVAAVAAESFYAGWDAGAQAYRDVPAQDRDWLKAQMQSLRPLGVPLVAIEYLPPARRAEATQLANKLAAQGYVPYIATPGLDTLGLGSVQIQPRRIALLYDPREGTVSRNVGHMYLGGLIEYLGYRVDYFPVDGSELPTQGTGLYAGAVVWMSSGSPPDPYAFNQWIHARLDENFPIAFFSGLPVDDPALLRRLGVRRSSEPPRPGLKLKEYDASLIGHFEAPLKLRARGMLGVSLLAEGPSSGLTVIEPDGREFAPVAIGGWGGLALAPYLIQENGDTQRWILDPFAFLERALRLPAIPRPDVTTENGRRIATVHIDGDGFPSRAEIAGTPYAGQVALDQFIKPYPFLTSVSVVEGEIGPRGMYPYLAEKLEPIARSIFAQPNVEVATHTFSHPFYWQPAKAAEAEGFEAEYGLSMAIPGYDELDMRREVIGSRDYINSRLTTPDKPVKMIFWTGDALPDAETIKLAYDAGLSNVNGGVTMLTRANPSLTGLYPLLRPTAGGLQVYAPIINENVYTNLWRGPFYGFKGVLETFDLTDSPRRLRGQHLYYHFYSATKQASIAVMHGIYKQMAAQQPFSLWMSDYVQRVHGLYTASLARRADGAWQIRGLDGLRTLRLDPQLGWPDLAASDGVAGVRDLPQGRYVHLSKAQAVLALRTDRDPAPALEQANLPLLAWEYLTPQRVRFSFAGEFALSFSVRASGACEVEHAGRRFAGRADKASWHFDLPMNQVRDAQLICQ